MVNVSSKPITKRTAIAKATMFLGKELISHFKNDELIPKKDLFFKLQLLQEFRVLKKHQN